MKRLIYGVSVVALVLAASFSFFSCNDYVQDELTAIKGDLYNEGGTIDALKKDLQRVELEYKKGIENMSDSLKKQIGDNYDELKGFIDDNSTDIGNLKEELKKFKETESEDVKKLQGEIDALEKQLADTLASYVTIDGLNETLKTYVTREELKDSLNSVAKAMADLEQLIKDNETAIKNNAAAIKDNADSIAATSRRLDSVTLALATRIGVLEAAVTTNPDGSITLSTEMQKAINVAVQAQIEAKAKELTLAYKHYVDSVSVADRAYTDSVSGADRAYTDEKYQQAIDSLNEVVRKASLVHDQVIAMADSLHKVVLEKISDLNKDLNNLSDEVTNLRDNYETFSSMCLEAISLLQDQIDDLNNKVTDLETAMGQLKTNYEKQITSIVLQGTYNNVFGSINLPFDIQSMLVAGHYGQINSDVDFPQAIPGITPSSTLTFEAGEEYREASGLVYFTVNPNTVSLDGVKFDLVNSLDENIGFNIGTPFKSNEKLSFGWTRANNGFYCAAVTPDSAYTIDELKPRINFSDIKSVLKQAFKDFEAKKTFDLKSIVRVIYDNSSDILDATAIKATWTDAYGAEKSVYTNYDMAATVMRPLSFEFDGFDTYADKLAAKLNKLHINNIKDVAFDFNIDIDTFSLNPLQQTVYPIVISQNGTTDTLRGNADLKEFVESINAYYVGQTENQVNDLINQIKDQVKSKGDSAIAQINNNYVSKVNNYINKYNNYLTRIINRLKNTDFNHYLQPCILICQDKHFGQVSTSIDAPTFVLGGDFIALTPTTFTSELLSPAMYKYLAVTKVYDPDTHTELPNSAEILAKCNKADYNMNVPFQFKQQVVLDLPEEDAIYEIEYQAIDWSGKVRTGKYYIQH